MVNQLKAEGVLLSAHGRHDNVLKIRPPMVFDTGNADQLLAALDTCFGRITGGSRR
jgi:4-aminobutyrate aminotransferase-like enzyme